MQTFTNKPLYSSGEPRNYNAIPVYFSFKEQLITKIHEHIKPQLIPIAVQHVANTNHYLLKQKLNPPNRKALLFNVANILLGNIDGQKDSTIILAYSIMEFINNAKQKQNERSNIAFSNGTTTTRKGSQRITSQQIIST